MTIVRTALVTGASHGLGYEMARRLAGDGHRVVVHAPTPVQAHAAVARLAGDGAPLRLLHPIGADFRRLSDVKSMAQHLVRCHERLDLLINNAGAMEPATTTGDGIDATFQVNYVAPYALTRLLAPALNAAGARIVTVASARHRDTCLDLDDPRSGDGRPVDAYARAQLALLLFTRALAETTEKRITAVAVHPGCLDTGTFAGVDGLGGLPVADGARHVLHAADPEVEVVNGGYYEGLLHADPAPAARDESAARRLWTATARLLGWDYTALRAASGVSRVSTSASAASTSRHRPFQ